MKLKFNRNRNLQNCKLNSVIFFLVKHNFGGISGNLKKNSVHLINFFKNASYILLSDGRHSYDLLFNISLNKIRHKVPESYRLISTYGQMR